MTKIIYMIFEDLLLFSLALLIHFAVVWTTFLYGIAFLNMQVCETVFNATVASAPLVNDAFTIALKFIYGMEIHWKTCLFVSSVSEDKSNKKKKKTLCEF